MRTPHVLQEAPSRRIVSSSGPVPLLFSPLTDKMLRNQPLVKTRSEMVVLCRVVIDTKPREEGLSPESIRILMDMVRPLAPLAQPSFGRTEAMKSHRCCGSEGKLVLSNLWTCAGPHHVIKNGGGLQKSCGGGTAEPHQGAAAALTRQDPLPNQRVRDHQRHHQDSFRQPYLGIPGRYAPVPIPVPKM